LGERKFVNLFSVFLPNNPRVFTKSGESRVYFNPNIPGLKEIGHVEDNPAYFKLYVLHKMRKLFRQMQVERWKEFSSSPIMGKHYLQSLVPKSISLTNQNLFVVNFVMSPIARIPLFPNGTIKFVYKGRTYKGETVA